MKNSIVVNVKTHNLNKADPCYEVSAEGLGDEYAVTAEKTKERSITVQTTDHISDTESLETIRDSSDDSETDGS